VEGFLKFDELRERYIFGSHGTSIRAVYLCM